MRLITVNFNGCKYLGEIHKIIKESLSLPDYYGENLDALWDCLDTYCDYDLYIIIQGLYSLPNNLADFVDDFRGLLEDVHIETPNIKFLIES